MNEVAIKKMKELGAKLREASKAYYQEDREIMPNVEYDALYDKLAAMEKEKEGRGRSATLTQQQFFLVISWPVLYFNVDFTDIFAYNSQGYQYCTTYQPEGNHQR